MDQIDNVRILGFSSRMEFLLQDKGGKLRNAVSVQSGMVGKQVSPVNLMGPIEAEEVTHRYQDSVPAEPAKNRRWYTPTDCVATIWEDDFDRLRTGLELNGQYEEAIKMAMGRKEDALILSAAAGDARVGELGGDNEAWSDTGRLVSEDVGGNDSGLNHAKLLGIRKILSANDVDLDAEEIFLPITENDVEALFGSTTTLSIDFVDGKPVTTGKLPSLYGINFIPFASKTLAKLGMKAASGGGFVYTTPCWVKSGLALGLWKDVKTEVVKMPSKVATWKVEGVKTVGATRLMLDKVLRVARYYSE